MTATLLLSSLALIGAALAIFGEYRGPRRLVYIFKPLTTILIILLALLAPIPEPALYKWTVVLGLIFSLGGDVFLMLPRDRFVPGLISFLIAHVWYIVAFSLRPEAWFTSGWSLLLLLYGIGISALLLPHVPRKLKAPVIIYMIVILLMAWRALEQWVQVGSTATLLAFVGAIFFVISDSVLALDRFRGRFSSARFIVLSTYWLAQWLIAYSIY